MSGILKLDNQQNHCYRSKDRIAIKYWNLWTLENFQAGVKTKFDNLHFIYWTHILKNSFVWLKFTLKVNNKKWTKDTTA